MAAPKNTIQPVGKQGERLRYELSKFFARRSGVLLTDTSIAVLADLLAGQADAEAEGAAERLIETLKRENSGYTNKHFPE